MLKNKIVFVSNISSNNNSFNLSSSSIPNTLFELMQNNVLIVDTSIKAEKNKTENKK